MVLCHKVETIEGVFSAIQCLARQSNFDDKFEIRSCSLGRNLLRDRSKSPKSSSQEVI
jgi:hypothetical protein